MRSQVIFITDFRGSRPQGAMLRHVNPTLVRFFRLDRLECYNGENAQIYRPSCTRNSPRRPESKFYLATASLLRSFHIQELTLFCFFGLPLCVCVRACACVRACMCVYVRVGIEHRFVGYWLPIHSPTLFEPPRGKTNHGNVVSGQARHKPAYTVTEAG